ncbi:MAG TPA: PIN domain-containing protein [Candidatus Nanoarchaeia archaeon]|nr:PIN domain-containing protein [Candidatus Nanoarchaeia archaeon]
MKLVVNTNRIIAALIKNSSSREIILHGKAELLSITITEKEIMKYKQMILKKTNITEEQFNDVYEKLKEKITFLPDSVINKKMEEAKKVMDAIDKDDTPFIAAALATDAAVWSDDNHFQKQRRVKIWKTKDIAPDINEQEKA